jgi:phosphoadenosine phosphosulfate reductase
MSKIEIVPPSPVQPAAEELIDLQDRAALLTSLAGLSPPQRLKQLRQNLPGRIAMTTAFGTEGQVMLHWIAEQDLDIDVVTLDTGRLFPETYELWAQTEQRYGRRIRAIYPEHTTLEALIAQQGINGFYDSREAREACCNARKVDPLKRALDGAQAWITGLRADQSALRAQSSVVTFDATRKLLKVSPLFDWTRQAVADFAAANRVPLNKLHAQGFVSIGCAPCTRAVAPGDPERAGRWWWEGDEKKECGLHLPRT